MGQLYGRVRVKCFLISRKAKARPSLRIGTVQTNFFVSCSEQISVIEKNYGCKGCRKKSFCFLTIWRSTAVIKASWANGNWRKTPTPAKTTSCDGKGRTEVKIENGRLYEHFVEANTKR